MDNNDLLVEFGEIKATLNQLVENQKLQAEQLSILNTYVNKWKGAAFVLLAIGAILSKISGYIIALLPHPPAS